jgi:hypothetical protein
MLAILVLGPGSLSAAAADKTDVVIMMNGDHFVGEIKKLEFGQLQFKASYMAASVNLDWTKVADVQSIRDFRVEFEDGELRTGVIRRSDGDFTVVDLTGPTTRGALEVVSIQPLEGSFVHRLRGSADIGLSLQEADELQWTGNLSAEYPAEKFRIFLQASSLFNKNVGAENTVRDSLSFAYYRYLSRHWFVAGMTNLLKDNELNLSLRATVAGAPGHYFIRSNQTALAAFSGIASTYEKYFDTSTSDNGNSAEALAGIEFYTVKFAKSQVNTTLLFYSGITQKGRRRVDWQSSISWKFWKDLYWKMTALENFDSRPPAGASRNDFSLTTTFGLTF